MKSILRYQQLRQPIRHINIPPQPSLGLVCVIPCLNEPDMLATLWHLHRCAMPNVAIEFIVVINHSEQASDAQRQCNIQIKQAIGTATENWPMHCRCHVITAFDLPEKKSGVGSARKIGMDEAMLRLADANSEGGLITSLDADCQVDQHYFTGLLAYAARYPKQHAMLCNFHHPFESITDLTHREAMVCYELLLRTIALGWAYAGLPYAFVAIGSCMVVRANAYARHHGMNTRQAGEDFYFMHKLAREHPIAVLHDVRVYPSPRMSTRTPFGTGQAIRHMCEGNSQQRMMAKPQVFSDLRQITEALGELYDMPDSNTWLATLQPLSAQFLQEQGLERALVHMRGNAASVDTFKKHFFTWFDGLKAWRMVHLYREQQAIPITEAAEILLQMYGVQKNYKNTAELLYQQRKMPMAEGGESD